MRTPLFGFIARLRALFWTYCNVSSHGILVALVDTTCQLGWSQAHSSKKEHALDCPSPLSLCKQERVRVSWGRSHWLFFMFCGCTLGSPSSGRYSPPALPSWYGGRVYRTPSFCSCSTMTKRRSVRACISLPLVAAQPHVHIRHSKCNADFQQWCLAKLDYHCRQGRAAALL